MPLMGVWAILGLFEFKKKILMGGGSICERCAGEPMLVTSYPCLQMLGVGKNRLIRYIRELKMTFNHQHQMFTLQGWSGKFYSSVANKNSKKYIIIIKFFSNSFYWAFNHHRRWRDVLARKNISQSQTPTWWEEKIKFLTNCLSNV